MDTKNIQPNHIPPPSVFVVVLQYNNSQDTLRCLESLKELDYPNYQVVVVDNASQEAEVNNIKSYIESQENSSFGLANIAFSGRSFLSSEETRSLQSVDSERILSDQLAAFSSYSLSANGLKKRLTSNPQPTEPSKAIFAKPDLRLLKNKGNLGYAGGNNVGIKYALENGADYVFILNNDTTLEPDTLKKLVAAAETDPKVGIVGPTIKEGEKTAYFGKISWLKTELAHSYSYPRTPLGKGQYIIGAAMLIKKEVLEKIEGFDEIYFLYFEDADLSIRTQLAGYKLKTVPEAVVHHKVSATTKELGSPLILRYHMRNALIFNSLNAPWRIKPFLIFWAGYVVLKNLVKMFIWPSKTPVADAIVEGVLDFYKNKFGKINA